MFPQCDTYLHFLVEYVLTVGCLLVEYIPTVGPLLVEYVLAVDTS